MTWLTVTMTAAALVVSVAVCAAEFHVSPEGSDANPGTIDRPFASIQKAADSMEAGDVCYLRAGRYHQPTKISGLHGTADRPITFQAYPGETATLDGSEAITSEWERHEGSIYRTELDNDIWQLFVDDKAMTPARWPNAHLEDGTAWDMKATWRHVAPESTFGHTIDNRPFHELTIKRGEKTYTPLADGVNSETLGDTGLDMTGAVAIMNIGSWLTWAQTVESHTAGSDEFTYSRDFSRSGPPMARAAPNWLGKDEFWNTKNALREQGHYYLEGKLELLDAPKEWFYDPETRMLYLWAPDGRDPAEHEVRGKTQTYALEVDNASHVTLRGLHFFGTTFHFLDCHHMTVDDCDLLYPSQSKLMLGDFERAQVTSLISSVRGGETMPEKSHSNTLRNCEFRHIDGPGLEIAGVGDLVENCLFAYIDNTCLGTGAGGSLNSITSFGLTFRRNTVHTGGNSEGFRSGRGALIEFNNLYDLGLMQSDGSAINVGIRQQDGTVVRRNWSHETNRGGIRFDAVSSSTNYGRRGKIHHNVVWRSHRIAVKGDEHVVLNNTAFDNGYCDIGILNHPPMGGINQSTVTRNNLAGKIDGTFWKPMPLPGTHDHNWTGDVRSQLRDPDNLDFRPRAGAEVIDSGAATPGVHLEHLGEAPDLGAYEFGCESYWIPGRKLPGASTPIPPDGATRVKLDADLMWLEGKEAISHDVYLGASETAVANANRESPEYKGNRATNILDPGPLKAARTYYWRVDAVTKDGTVAGAVWSFTTE